MVLELTSNCVGGAAVSWALMSTYVGRCSFRLACPSYLNGHNFTFLLFYGPAYRLIHEAARLHTDAGEKDSMLIQRSR